MHVSYMNLQVFFVMAHSYIFTVHSQILSTHIHVFLCKYSRIVTTCPKIKKINLQKMEIKVDTQYCLHDLSIRPLITRSKPTLYHILFPVIEEI